MHILRKILGSAVFISLALLLAPIAWLGYLSRNALAYLCQRLLGMKLE